MTKKTIDDLSYQIIGCAIEVHKELGPGLLESVYEKCLIYELKSKGFEVHTQQNIPIHYKSIVLDGELRFDLLVENSIVVELKAVDSLLPIHEAILLTYMKMLEKPKGILLNFCSTNIFNKGQKTFVNEFFRNLPDV